MVMDNKTFKANFYERIKVFCIAIAKLEDQFTNKISSREVYRQLIRSANSILGNFSEGNGAQSKKEFLRFMNIARKSALETSTWLDLMSEIILQNKSKLKLQKLLDESIEIRKILGSIVLKTRKSLGII